MIQEAYPEVLEKNGIIPLTSPEIDEENIKFDKQTHLSFEVTIEVNPEFELGDYKGIDIPSPKV